MSAVEAPSQGVIGVEFERYGQLHYLTVDDPQAFSIGQAVRYPTESGVEVAHVVWRGTSAATGIPRCDGPATPDDLKRDQAHRERRAAGREIAVVAIRELDLPMQVVGVDFVEDDAGQLFAIYYESPGRVDFRALVPVLARRLQARVDLRQVAARDSASLIGGVGRCGLTLCCASWLPTLEPVSIRLANQQGTTGVGATGVCGRLLCCLRYESDGYAGCSEGCPKGGQ